MKTNCAECLKLLRCKKKKKMGQTPLFFKNTKYYEIRNEPTIPFQAYNNVIVIMLRIAGAVAYPL